MLICFYKKQLLGLINRNYEMQTEAIFADNFRKQRGFVNNGLFTRIVSILGQKKFTKHEFNQKIFKFKG
jgi:uncharacterized protein YkuJ